MDDTIFSAECVVAVLGIEHALRPAPKQPSEAELARAAKLPAVIRRRTKELLDLTRATGSVPPPELPEYHPTQSALARGVDGDALADSFLGMPAELQGPCASIWGAAIAYLNQLLPMSSETLLTGAKLHDPAPGAYAEWGWAWRIANEPMVIFDLAADGILIGAEVSHLAALFPAIYSEICAAIADGLSDRAAKDKDWVAPWWLQKQLCTILQISAVSRTLVDDLDKAVQQAKAKTQQAPSRLNVTNNDSTPNQRLADR